MHKLSLLLLLLNTLSYTKTWSDIRDGVLFLRMSANTSIEVTWKPIWSSEGHEETIYFQAPNGKLIMRKNISAGEKGGSINLAASEGAGDYRLEIPGYSFRSYTVNTPESVKMVFTPPAVHLSLHINKNNSYYFKSNNNKFIYVKNFSGVENITCRLDDKIINKQLIQYPQHYEYDSIQISANRNGFSEFKSETTGKVGFWLNSDNFFSLDTNDWFLPVQKQSNITITIDNVSIGNRTFLGASVPDTKLPEHGYQFIKNMGIQSISLYAMQDRIDFKRSEKSFAYYHDYQNKLSSQCMHTIIHADRKRYSNGIASQNELPQFAEFARTVVNETSDSGPTLHFFSFFDEPSNRFKNKELYFNQFDILMKVLKPVLDKKKNCKIVIPESSGFLNGPTKNNSDLYRGIDWCEPLIKKYKEQIGGIAWHEWNCYDLIAVEWYAKNIDAAAQLLKKYGLTTKNTRLMITQTNIASGPTFSPYEQNSFYAALWLGSVYAQCVNTGKLHSLCWYPLLEEKNYKKGLVNYINGSINTKPAAIALQYINSNTLETVLKSNNNSLEIETVATINQKGSEMALLIINKTDRVKSISIQVNLPESMKKKKILLTGEHLNERASIEKFDFKNNITVKSSEINFQCQKKGFYLFHLKT